MQEDKLYDTLLNLPLFLGMSRADLLQIAGHTKFDFQKIEGGETLTEIGEPYHRLLFLLSGEVAVETMADDRGYRIVETIKAPEVFMIERLFGYDQHSPHHYVARNDCSLMSISKKKCCDSPTNTKSSTSICSTSSPPRHREAIAASSGYPQRRSATASSDSSRTIAYARQAKKTSTSRWSAWHRN